MSRSNIVVIGSGITGITTAYALLRQGHAVTVIDRLPYSAMETSYANGGQLSASNAEVWNSWPTVFKGLRWMLDAKAPLLINPAPSFHKLSWMAEFVAAIRNHRANTIETTRLAIQARKILFDIADREHIDFDLQRRGILHLYYDRESFAVAERGNELLREGGLVRYAVTDQEIHAIEPTLQGRFHAGFFTPSDATGDIRKFTRGLAEACLRKGARFLTNTSVTDIESRGAQHRLRMADTESGEQMNPITADAVVVCAGVASRHFASMLGDRINIYPVKGYSITVSLEDAASQAAAPTVSLLDESAKIVTSRLGHERLRIAGTAEFNGYNLDIRADRIEPLVRWSRRLFPRVSTATVIPWAGLRPMTPDMMPRVGRGRRPGIYYNTGHGHLGWTLSAATAALVSHVIGEDLAVPEDVLALAS
ncbi:MAG TPA: D-amino acid dehydrogenase [Steroidobacteraceae bacterium]|nr:D-amino acid dehydrogenase [Steroidobacteraceae bacterium]